MTTVEWRRLADGMADPIMEVDMETSTPMDGYARFIVRKTH